MATETEFIDWLRTEKGIDIDRKMAFSTYGSLGKTYETEEGIELFYGLSVKGFPPHLDLSFVRYKNNIAETPTDYMDIQRSFYSGNYSKEEMYEILIKNKVLNIK